METNERIINISTVEASRTGYPQSGASQVGKLFLYQQAVAARTCHWESPRG